MTPPALPADFPPPGGAPADDRADGPPSAIRSPAAHASGRRAIRAASALAVEHAQALQGKLLHVGDTMPTPEASAVKLVEGVLAELGAAMAVAYRVADDGETVEAVGATRDLAELPFGGRHVPVSADLLVCDAVRTGRVLHRPTRAALLTSYPELRPAVERMGIEAAAAFPARHMGRVHGALVLAWDTPRRLTSAEQTQLHARAGRLARALAYARLYYAERAAHAEAERLRDQAESARREAEAANRAKDDFLAVVSHELRTPMQAILGFSDLLGTEIAGPLAPRQHDYVRRVQAAGGQLLDTIENLLGFARAQAGKEVVDAAAFDAAAVVVQVLDIAAPLAGRKGVELVQEGAPSDVAVVSDERKFRQIVTNLVANAVKFTDRGRVTAEAAVVHDAVAGARLRVTVRDTGIGIAADQLARVFEPFVQAAAGPGGQTTTRPAGGTGLGLSIVRQLARLLGGEVSATSVVGEGSTFVVEVPRVYGGAGR
ncbi:hypothetical protein tb265_09770 [Gemmatimonadetes bacterium T265]|nr:hypothetical protein tb265_09770 [Gemmatimonadetes bacterium T265]